MDKQFLIKTDKNTRLLIKSEAEKNLQDIHSSEDMLTNKINILISVSFAVVIGLISYTFKDLSKIQLNLTTIVSIIILSLFLFVLLILLESLFPKENRSKGAEPNSLIQDDMIKGDLNDENRILCNRIESLQKAINTALTSYRDRLDSYKLAYKILSYGLLILSLSAIAFVFIYSSISVS